MVKTGKSLLACRNTSDPSDLVAVIHMLQISLCLSISLKHSDLRTSSSFSVSRCRVDYARWCHRATEVNPRSTRTWWALVGRTGASVSIRSESPVGGLI